MKTTFTDQMSRKIDVLHTPKRIISIVPSLTELLCDMNLKDQLVGVTRFCIHPANLKKQTEVIGGTKNLKIDKILSLQPDIVIGNKEENTKDQILELEKHCNVWMSDINDLSEAQDCILKLGDLLDRMEESQQIVLDIQLGFNSEISRIDQKCLYLIWKAPYMAAGSGTFINDMINRSGYSNVLSDQKRYPSITEEQIAALNPDVIMLSSEPYPFKDKHIDEFKQLCPGAKVLVVDGEMFSWYGSRLIKSGAYFQKLRTEIELL